mgnify:CR=1 FL=1
MSKIIEFQKIIVAVPNQKTINIESLSFKTGDTIQVNAASGRGKSYLYHTFLGMTESSKTLYKSGVPQHNLFAYCPASLNFFSATVQEELDRVHDDDMGLHECLDFGLIDSSFLGKKCNDLSNGENQLLVFLRGALSKKPIIILDELTNSMDLNLREKIWSYIQSVLLNRCAVIYNSHFQSEIVPNKIISF